MTPTSPPTADRLLSSVQLIAGAGIATVLPDFDFETYCEAGFVWSLALNKWKRPAGAPSNKKGLAVVGAAVYSEHPTCEVLSLKYDLKDGRGAQWWRPGYPSPVALFDHLARGGLLEAHNVGFEAWIWRNVCVPRYGWPALPEAQLRCSMAKARAHALPGALDALGDVLKIETRKDKDGKRLLDKFSIPRNPTKTDPRRRIEPDDDPVDAEKLYAYNGTDIVAEAQSSARIPDLSADELAHWQHDQQINTRGVAVDGAAVANCVAVIEQAYERYNGELAKLTGGVAEQASQTERIKGWLASRGVHMQSMDEEAVTYALEHHGLVGAERRVLEIRQLVASASVKKLYALSHTATRAGRVHDLYSYHGARPGRATGGGVQPQNLPKDGPEIYRCVACAHWFGAHTETCPWCGMVVPLDKLKPLPWTIDAIGDALAVIATRSLDLVELFFGDAMALIVGCLRGLFIAAPGHDLIASDYTAIEAVVLAALAGEQWRLDTFAAGKDIYLASASRTTGTPMETYEAHRAATGAHHPHRQPFGKVLELALGYGGWVGAMQAFGADEFFTVEQMVDAVKTWRARSPAIVEFWGGQFRGLPWEAHFHPEMYGLEGAAILAIQNPGERFTVRGVTYFKRGKALYCELPSGRPLTYHDVGLRLADRGPYKGLALSIVFYGWNTNPKMGQMGWVQLDTYGPKLAENVTQAVARDIFYDGKLRLERAGYPVVLHTHDEPVAEVREGWGSVEEFERVMGVREKYYATWPIGVSGGWRGKRYRKV